MVVVDPAAASPQGPLPAGAPLAARVLAAADSALSAAAGRAAAVVVIAGDGPLPGQRLADLLGDAALRIGAVLADRAADQGAVTSVFRDATAADLAATTAGQGAAIAVRAQTVVTAGIQAESDDVAEVTGRLLAAVAASGQRIVLDPVWVAQEAAEPTGGGAAGAPSGDPTSGALVGPAVDVLFVTTVATDPRLRAAERAVEDLLSSLGQVVDGRLSVMTTERVPPADRRRWSSSGIEVLAGPAAWEGRSTRRYSHVIVTAEAARSSVREWIEAHQAQAHRVVYFPALPPREVAALVPITPADEIEGLLQTGVDAQNASAHLAQWADSIWCQWAADAPVLQTWAPRNAVHLIPGMLRPGGDRRPFELRSGVLVSAGEGADVVAGNEDAALRVIEEILPLIRARDASVPCTVLADRPTPMLIQACRAAGVTIEPTAQLAHALAGTRILVGGHNYGVGQPAVVMSAIEAGTPFVITPTAAGDLDLAALTGSAVCGAAVDQAARAWRLLSDRDHWNAVVAEADRLAAGSYGPDRHRRALTGALAPLGIAADPAARQAAPRPAVPARPAPAPVKPQPRLALRPPGTPEPGELPDEVPLEEAERYRLWHERWGPNSGVLAAISAEVGQVAYRPLISILMPVYNTDAEVLGAAVESVRAQLYDHWQLCIANDGSDRPETIEVLSSLRDDPKVSIVDRPGSSGISRATNAALETALGEYVTFLDHDDELKPHALAQVVRWLDADPEIDVLYSDEDKLDPEGLLYDPHIKPDWSPDQLMSQNYVCHLTVARRSLVEKVGGLRPEFDGSQDYDLILRLGEVTDRIVHIPEPLYSWRAVPGSAAAVADAKPYAIEAGRRAVADALRRRGYGDRVDTTGRIGFHRARYPIPGAPKVSIIVPTKDGRHLLERCLRSVIDRSTYRNYEIVVIDNQSTDGAALEYMARGPWRVIRYPYRFNYARMMNLAARSVDCDALLFLNNDTEIISPDWIEGLLEHAMRPEVGAVGGRLYFPDGAPQHEGIMLGIGGWAHNTNHYGYWGRGEMTRNVSAVTGACTMMRPSVYRRIGGNDERLRVAYNDVDLCLRVRQAGYQVVYTPHVELYHHESSTRGKYEHHEDGPLFGIRWRIKENVDPYYSPMFEDFPPFLIRL